MSQFFGDSIFWIEVDKIKPNPYQPRREFDEARLKDLAESIRMYGVLQPLVVTRTEREKDDGGITTEYELISGERRLRASRLAGIREVPVIIRRDTDDARLKLELAIIENLQREDLNPVDRARAFKQLIDEFKFKHSQIADKVGKSREYVSNSLRILDLPEEMLNAVIEGRLSEGHTRPILMLTGRPAEQVTLFKEIIFKKLTVRDAERIARSIAVERVRKPETLPDQDTADIVEKLSEAFGTRVEIERRGAGGRLHVDFFSQDDLAHILELLKTNPVRGATAMMDAYIAKQQGSSTPTTPAASVVVPPIVAALPVNDSPVQKVVQTPSAIQHPLLSEIAAASTPIATTPTAILEPAAAAVGVVSGVVRPESEVVSEIGQTAQVNESAPPDDRTNEEKKDSEDELYSLKNFSL